MEHRRVCRTAGGVLPRKRRCARRHLSGWFAASDVPGSVTGQRHPASLAHRCAARFIRLLARRRNWRWQARPLAATRICCFGLMNRLQRKRGERGAKRCKLSPRTRPKRLRGRGPKPPSASLQLKGKRCKFASCLSRQRIKIRWRLFCVAEIARQVYEFLSRWLCSCAGISAKYGTNYKERRVPLQMSTRNRTRCATRKP